MTPAEREERARLDDCLDRIERNLAAIDTRLESYACEIQAAKTHL